MATRLIIPTHFNAGLMKPRKGFITVTGNKEWEGRNILTTLRDFVKLYR